MLVTFGDLIHIKMLGPDGPGDGVRFQIWHQSRALTQTLLNNFNQTRSTEWRIKSDFCPEVDPEERIFWVRGTDSDDDYEIMTAHWDDFRDILVSLTGLLHIVEEDQFKLCIFLLSQFCQKRQILSVLP